MQRSRKSHPIMRGGNQNWLSVFGSWTRLIKHISPYFFLKNTENTGHYRYDKYQKALKLREGDKLARGLRNQSMIKYWVVWVFFLLYILQTMCWGNSSEKCQWAQTKMAHPSGWCLKSHVGSWDWQLWLILIRAITPPWYQCMPNGKQ